MLAESLFEKIKALPPDKIAEVEDFIDFLSHRSLQEWRQARQAAIAAYAAQYAGSDVDLDLELESAAIEQLRKIKDEYS